MAGLLVLSRDWEAAGDDVHTAYQARGFFRLAVGKHIEYLINCHMWRSSSLRGLGRFGTPGRDKLPGVSLFTMRPIPIYFLYSLGKNPD